MKLNLGCGTDIRKGFSNLDKSPLPGVDCVHDIEQLPLPYADASCDEIVAQDVLEHVEWIPLLKELHRLLCTGGVLRVRVPHFTSRNNFVDPTHKKQFSCDTFDFFVATSSFSKSAQRHYYFDFQFSEISQVHVRFPHWSKWFFLNRIVEPYVNRSRHRQRIYEASGWSRLFPAENLEIVLVK